MKYTLLQAVNLYLDYTDGFRVSTIDDTIESQQVAAIAQKVFHDLNDDIFNNEQLQELIQLEALADNTKPNYLRLPDDVSRIKESKVMYDISEDSAEIKMVEIDYLPPLEFLELVGNTKVDTDNEIVTDYSGYRMVIPNEQAPQYYTDFDDEYLVFDAFNSTVDSTMQSSKSGVLVNQRRSFTQSDTYVIDFPEWFHTTYVNALISEASIALREEPNVLADRKARMGIIKARKKQRIGTSDSKRNRGYGR